MLWIHLLQQWYSFSHPSMQDALIEMSTMRRFAGIDLISEAASLCEVQILRSDCPD